jgi:CreA protein
VQEYFDLRLSNPKQLMRPFLYPLVVVVVASVLALPAYAAEEPDLIFRRSTVFKWLTPNDKLATYGLDDPDVDGVACHFTVPERGGFKGWIGIAEEVSDISLSCSQVGPIVFKAKFEQGEDVFRKRRSLFFKKMQIVRGCDVKRNVLVYMVYSDRLIEGSPKNSTSSVPIMPWGNSTVANASTGSKNSSGRLGPNRINALSIADAY